MGGDAVNQLFYGDNLNVLRASIKDETVDLIYLDPPFMRTLRHKLRLSRTLGLGFERPKTLL
jgi:16S rRNA G966 N2-methylase RsmD